MTIEIRWFFGQDFRDDIGNLTAVPASDLELQLKDFGPKALVRAEPVEKLAKERKREMDQLELGMRKRERQRTPPELNSDDEQSYLDSCLKIPLLFISSRCSYALSASPSHPRTPESTLCWYYTYYASIFTYTHTHTVASLEDASPSNVSILALQLSRWENSTSPKLFNLGLRWASSRGLLPRAKSTWRRVHRISQTLV